MSKQQISKEKLAEWMNENLHDEEGYEDFHMLAVTPLAELTPEGNNWSFSGIRHSTNHQNVPIPETVMSKVKAIVTEAQKLFNLL